MYCSKIITIKEGIPVKPGSLEDSDPTDKYSDMVMLHGSRESAINHEKGMVCLELEIEPFQTLEHSYFMFMDEVPIFASMVSILPIGDNTFELKLFVNIKFINGFSSAFEALILPTKQLFVFTEEEFTKVLSFPMQKAIFKSMLDGLMPAHKAVLLKLSSPCLLLNPDEDSNESKSYFLGQADLGAGTSVPQSKDNEEFEHLISLHSQNLVELSKDYPLFHEDFYLSFYINTEDDDWNSDKKNFAVIKSDSVGPKKNPDEWAYKQMGVKCTSALSIPDIEHPVIERLKFNQSDITNYRTLQGCFYKLARTNIMRYSCSMGYPEEAYQDLEIEIATRILGRKSQKDLKEEASQWRLLLQVNSDNPPFVENPIISNCSLFFMIRISDLQKGDFSKVELITQIT